jgi:putative two-component system response regulator
LDREAEMKTIERTSEVTSPTEDVQSHGTILIVDDEATVARQLQRILSARDYLCLTASSADQARKHLADRHVDLILCDVNMPGESGLDLLEETARIYPETATVLVTGMDDTELAERALAMGAYGYVIKPFEPNEIIIDVSNALRRRTLEIENKRHREKLESRVEERTVELWTAIRRLEHADKDLRKSREETVRRLSLAAEFRDDETAQHVNRMSLYCELIFRRRAEEYDRCELIRTASAMHDVGKIGIPDRILLKAGPLTDEEFDVMRTHASIGHRILDGSDSDLLVVAAGIALTHHEWWDGSGYPRGLKGAEIPLEGRVAAIADVFDALTSDRVYRKGYSFGEAVELMTKERGTHFDPELLDLFFDSLDEVIQISVRRETS